MEPGTRKTNIKRERDLCAHFKSNLGTSEPNYGEMLLGGSRTSVGSKTSPRALPETSSFSLVNGYLRRIEIRFVWGNRLLVKSLRSWEEHLSLPKETEY